MFTKKGSAVLNRIRSLFLLFIFFTFVGFVFTLAFFNTYNQSIYPLQSHFSSVAGPGLGSGENVKFATITSGKGNSSVFIDIIDYMILVFISFFLAIIFKYKLFKRTNNSKKIICTFRQKDNAWKYENIFKQVRDTYFIVQNSWGNLDMQPAKDYMTDELYHDFSTKIKLMVYGNRKNIFKKIKLINSVPVSVYDNDDNSCCYVWFYIKGSMIDNIINTNTNLKIQGSSSPTKFEEYWQFVREENGQWILNKILQKNVYSKMLLANKM